MAQKRKAKQMPNTNQFFTVTEVAKREKVSSSHIRKLISEGRITGAQKLWNRWLLPKNYTILSGNPIGRPKKKL